MLDRDKRADWRVKAPPIMLLRNAKTCEISAWKSTQSKTLNFAAAD